MKRSLLIGIVSLVTVFTSCTKKTDSLFPDDPDTRIRQTIDGYNNKLFEGPGWKLFLYPSGLQSEGIEVGGLTYYLKFPDSNRVSMVSDFTIDMASVPKESSYRIKVEQRPSLLFDTYSYIHVAADPDPDVSFSPTSTGGYGWGTDFDFSFTSNTPSDSIVLKGNFNNSDAYLLKATQEEMDAAFGGQLAHIMDVTSQFSSSSPFLFFTGTDNSKVGVSFNLFLYRINFSLIEGGVLSTLSAPFSHTTTGLHLKNPITVGGQTFQDLLYDEATQEYYLATDGGRLDIQTSELPLFPFYTQLGTTITTITLPTTPLPGQSSEFAAAYQLAKDNLITSPYVLELGEMNFIFDDASKVMSLQGFVIQDGVQFLMHYVYTYTLNSAGDVTFTLIDLNNNAELVQNEMAPLLNYLENDVFKMDYYTDVTPVLGQFISKDRPGFFFTGNIQ